MAAVLLALSASLAWGFADLGAGVGSRRVPVPVVLVVLARTLVAERIARPQLAGVAAVLAGVALVSAG